MGKAILAAASLWYAIIAAWSSTCDAHEITDFKQPQSECVSATPNKIITSVGTFDGGVRGKQPLNVVAIAKIDDSEQSFVLHEAAISLYDQDCHLIYINKFPDRAEVRFDTIHFGRDAFLHVVSISSPDRPVDDEITDHYLLSEDYTGSISNVLPTPLFSDKSADVYMGDLGHGRGFGVVQTYHAWHQADEAPKHFSSRSVIYGWRQFRLSNGRSFAGFSGPKILNGRKSQAEHWPDVSGWHNFPLMEFLYYSE